ncbi:MAG: leucine-rich repeat protein [Clostridia bacterium]|nr:leucine-rich repeat protein [Clostridia bacterium]
MKHINQDGTFYFELEEKETGLSSFYIRKNREIKKAVLPRGLKRIEEMAFYSCKNLREVVIPDTVEFLGDDLFAFSSDDVRIEYEGSSAKWRKLTEGVEIERYELKRGQWDKYPYYNDEGSEYVKERHVMHFDWYCDKIEVFCKKDGVTLYYGWGNKDKR